MNPNATLYERIEEIHRELSALSAKSQPALGDNERRAYLRGELDGARLTIRASAVERAKAAKLLEDT